MIEEKEGFENSVQTLVESIKVLARGIGDEYVVDIDKLRVFAEAARRSRERFLAENAREETRDSI
jgi:hypothetical protein